MDFGSAANIIDARALEAFRRSEPVESAKEIVTSSKVRVVPANQRQLHVSGQSTLSFSLGSRVKVLTFQIVEQFELPVLLGTPGLSKFKCSLHFTDDQDPYLELEAEGTAKKEHLVPFLEEEKVLLILEAIPLFSSETVAVTPGMKMLDDTQISKRIRSLLCHDFFDVLMKSHTGRIEQSEIFVNRQLQ